MTCCAHVNTDAVQSWAAELLAAANYDGCMLFDNRDGDLIFPGQLSLIQDMHICRCQKETAEALHVLPGCYTCKACSIGYHMTAEFCADCPL